MQFKAIVGQDLLKSEFIRTIHSEKISHAQLFLGNFGFGGLPLALSFCQFLFCEDKQLNDSCGVCSSCIKVADLQHPDLHFSFPTVLTISKTSSGLMKEWREKVKQNPYFDLSQWTDFIDPKGRKPTIGADESLEIIKKLSLKSYEGGMKVMIIWGASEMNPTAANKLLKIIEEPPKNTLFILISESDEYMLQTILSRTQMVKIPHIDRDILSKHLQSNFHLNSSNADSIAARSEGDLIRASDFAGEASADNQDREWFIELMRVCYKKDVLQMLKWAENMGNQSREKQKGFMKYALHMFRQSLLKNYTDNVLVRVSDEEAGFLNNFSKFITGNNAIDFMETFNDGHYYIERNANAKILFTTITFNVMRYIHVA